MRRKTEKKGFTILEVMLFLAITGLMLIGVIGGTYSAIASQRYTDSVRSFAEFLRQTYAEVISPETLKEQGGNDNKLAIYGKAIIFGADGASSDTKDDHIYTVTLVGSAEVPSTQKTTSSDPATALSDVGLKFLCEGTISGAASTVTNYAIPWQAKVMAPKGDTKPDSGAEKEDFKGTVIIARTPGSGAVHTLYAKDYQPYGIKENNCNSYNETGPSAGNDSITKQLSTGKFKYNAINFCIKEDQSSNTSRMRDIRLAEDGRNTSAISLIDLDGEDSWCR